MLNAVAGCGCAGAATGTALGCNGVATVGSLPAALRGGYALGNNGIQLAQSTMMGYQVVRTEPAFYNGGIPTYELLPYSPATIAVATPVVAATPQFAEPTLSAAALGFREPPPPRAPATYVTTSSSAIAPPYYTTAPTLVATTPPAGLVNTCGCNRGVTPASLASWGLRL